MSFWAICRTILSPRNRTYSPLAPSSVIYMFYHSFYLFLYVHVCTHYFYLNFFSELFESNSIYSPQEQGPLAEVPDVFLIMS